MNTHSMESSSSLSSSLGKPPLTKTDEFSEKFHRGPKFGPLNRAFSSWKWYKGVILGYVFQPITMLNCCTTCISTYALSTVWFSENSSVLVRGGFPYHLHHKFYRHHHHKTDNGFCSGRIFTYEYTAWHKFCQIHAGWARFTFSYNPTRGLCSVKYLKA